MFKFAFLAVGCCVSAPLWADVTCNTVTGSLGGDASHALSGCLTGGTGLIANPSGEPWNDASIAWNIVQNAGGYLYSYTFTNAGSSENMVSHLIIGLSNNCFANTNCITNLSNTNVGEVEIKTHTQQQGNPGMPGDLYGIKINTTGDPATFEFSFQSDRVPVWQNFYAKDGTFGDEKENVFAYNSGFSGLGFTGDRYFIAAPDSVVPEPGFYGLLSLGLVGLYAAVRRRKQAV